MKVFLIAASAILAFSAVGARAANLITNGDFETGDYTGWNANVEDGSQGALTVVANDGGFSPLSGSAYAYNSNGGNFFSITDQNGEGSYSLTQSFTLSSASTVNVSFDMFANDQAGVIYNNGRDYNTQPNQNAEVDILTGTADAFTNDPADIVSTLYGPGADDVDNNPNPWTSYSDTLSLAAGTYQIRFAETDNQLFFQQGVDNVVVSVASGTPEPSTWALMIVGIGGVGAALRLAARQRKDLVATTA